jgi:RNA polymerase sigma-B factor
VSLDRRPEDRVAELEPHEAVGDEILDFRVEEQLREELGEQRGAVGGGKLQIAGDGGPEWIRGGLSRAQRRAFRTGLGQLVQRFQRIREYRALVRGIDLQLDFTRVVYPAIHGRLCLTLAMQSTDKRTLDDRRLLTRYRDNGDPRAREELVKRFLPLARQLARRYQRTNEPLDDLMQVASVGLVKAIDRFDPDRGTAFSTFAVPTILGELKRYFRDSGWAVHVPRGMQERSMKVDQAVDTLHRRLGRTPSTREVAAELELSEEEVLEAIEVHSAYEALSLEQQRTDDSESGGAYVDTIASDEERYELVEYAATIAPALQALSPRDRQILHLRFSEDLTQSEIAERIGVSQMHVSRLIRRALTRLRTVAKASETEQ